MGSLGLEMSIEPRLEQAQVLECFVCRQAIDPVLALRGAGDDRRLATCRDAGVCPACGTPLDAEPRERAEVERRACALWSGLVEAATGERPARLPLFRQGVLGCATPGPFPRRPGAPF